jgi:pimeloyl-ACP methyl ester carboxylesterase
VILPKEKRSERLWPNRTAAELDFCSYSVGDMLVPAACMPRLAQPKGFFPPSWLYLIILPGSLYFWGPGLLFIALCLLLRRFWKLPLWLFLILVPICVIVVSSISSPEVTGNCLSGAEKAMGAKVVPLSDGYIEYFRMGSRHPDARRIVLHHGSLREGGAFRFFEPLFKELNLDVIAPTLPGFGCSTPQPGRTIADWPKTVSMVLADAGWLADSRPFLVAGYSFGGPHALALAAAMQDKVSGAFIVSSTMPPEHVEAVEALAKKEGFATERDHDTGLMKKFFEKYGETDLARGLLEIGLHVMDPLPRLATEMEGFSKAGLGDLRRALEQSSRRSLSRSSRGLPENVAVRARAWGFDLSSWQLAGPVVLLAERGDDIDPPFIQAFLASRIKNAQFYYHEPASNFGHWHYWAHFEEELRFFIDKL